MTKVEKDTWQIIVTYQATIHGYRGQNFTEDSFLSSGVFEYRILIDDLTNMLGGNFQIRLPISKSSGYFATVPEVVAYPWFHSKKGHSGLISIESLQLGRNFSIVVHTPPSFDENTYKSYPVVIVLDLDEHRYNKTKHQFDIPIVVTETIGESILIGFGDYLSVEDRLELLSQVSGPWYVCVNGTTPDGCAGCVPTGVNFTEYVWYMEHRCGQTVEMTGKGNATLDFLIDTVLPHVRKLTNLRMRKDQPNLGIMGFSLGGMLACHAAWTRPDIFGLVACQSPSFWWPYVNFTAPTGSFFNAVTLKDETLRQNRPYQKIYLDVGGKEPGGKFALAQKMFQAAEIMVSTTAFNWDRNFWAYVFPSDPHAYLNWEMRIWNPLKLFFPTNPGPRLDSETCTVDVNSSAGMFMEIIVLILCVFVALSTAFLF